jgi:hypothetical protein
VTKAVAVHQSTIGQVSQRTALCFIMLTSRKFSMDEGASGCLSRFFAVMILIDQRDKPG